MSYLMGIDLGTSSVKTVLMDVSGNVVAISQQEYSFDIPREGWAEQDPEVWWSATVKTIQGALDKAGIAAAAISGIGFSGQMHGLVPLDRDGRPVRKAIIWCDQRSVAQVEEIRTRIGVKRLGDITGNPIATGFQTASLLWMKENEPDLYEKIRTVILPKDYIRFCLTGELSTDVTDAASTLALDVRQAEWADELICNLGLQRALYPAIFLPESPAGTVTQSAADLTHLAFGTKVFHGGADQVMQAIGNGILVPGQVSVTIGTGGQVFAPLSEAVYDPFLRTHTFNNFAKNSWYFLGASLSAGLSLRWLRDTILGGLPYAEMDQQVNAVSRGSDGLIFLPYLSGERTPHMDPHARGLFFGLTLNHNRAHLIRSVMEGVVFALRDCMDVYRDLGQTCSRIIASGGGARSATWLQMQADILGVEVQTTRMLEQAGVGAAIAAGVGAGLYQNYQEACALIVKWSDVIYTPDSVCAHRYTEQYQLYQELYIANKDLMHRCTVLSRS